MDMILFEVFLKNIHFIPQDQKYNDIIYNINSAVVISVVVESSRCSSKTLRKGSCPYAPLDEALRYDICYTVKVEIFAYFAQILQARIQKPAKIFAIFCMHILDA